jgi:hypothetical protein
MYIILDIYDDIPYVHKDEAGIVYFKTLEDLRKYAEVHLSDGNYIPIDLNKTVANFTIGLR